MFLLLLRERLLGLYIARVVWHFPFNVIIDITEDNLLASMILSCISVFLAYLIVASVDNEVCVHLVIVVHHISLLEFLRLVQDPYNIK